MVLTRMAALCLATGLAAGASPTSAQVIGTDPPAGPGGYAFGVPSSGGWGDIGQTFTATTTGSVVDFSFWLYKTPGVSEGTTSFTGHLFEWTGGGIGTELFASSLQAATVGESPVKTTVDVFGAAVVSGQQYLAIFRPTEPFENVGFSVTSEVYSGGSIYTELTDLRTWADAPFEVTLRERHAVPEPSSWLLLASGLLSLGFVTRRRRETVCS